MGRGRERERRDCSGDMKKTLSRGLSKMCLKAVIMLHLHTCGAGRHTRRIASELEYLASCRAGCMPNGCLAFMPIILAHLAGRQPLTSSQGWLSGWRLSK